MRERHVVSNFSNQCLDACFNSDHVAVCDSIYDNR